MPPATGAASKIVTEYPMQRQIVRGGQAHRAAADHRDFEGQFACCVGQH